MGLQTQSCRELLPSGGCGIHTVNEGLDGALVKYMKEEDEFRCEERFQLIIVTSNLVTTLQATACHP